MIDEKTAKRVQQESLDHAWSMVILGLFALAAVVWVIWKVSSSGANPFLRYVAGPLTVLFVPGFVLTGLANNYGRLIPKCLRPVRTVTSDSIVYHRSAVQGTIIWAPFMAGFLGLSLWSAGGAMGFFGVVWGILLWVPCALIAPMLVPRGTITATITPRSVRIESSWPLGDETRNFDPISTVSINSRGGIELDSNAEVVKRNRFTKQTTQWTGNSILSPMISDPHDVTLMARDILAMISQAGREDRSEKLE